MNRDPLVLIVMPAFNCGDYIAAAIDSIAAQTYQHWHLVIVDDGSTDQTGRTADEYARRDPARIAVIHQPNAGIARARNRALAEAHPDCEWTAFLDSDDVWYPSTLATMVLAARRSQAVVGVHGLRTYIDKMGRRLTVNGGAHAPLRRRAIHHGRLRTVEQTEPTTFNVLAYGCCVFTGALLVRTAALRQAGLFDPHAVPAEDWDMWLRLSLQGPFEFCPEASYGYRLHGLNSTANAVKKHRALYYVRRKFVSDPNLPYPTRWTMIAGFRWYEVYQASVCFRQLAQRASVQTMPELSRLGLSGLGHLWTSVRPGVHRLDILASQSADGRDT